MSAGWYVVKFKNEKNIIEVIPSNWIKNFEACFWPLKFGSIKLQSAIKCKSRKRLEIISHKSHMQQNVYRV